MKTKSLISGLAMLALVFGAQRGVTAAGDSQKKKPPAQDTYTITQLDIGANVASTGQLISDNQVVAGNLQGDSLFAFAWSAQTGFVVLTLGGSSSLVSGISSNGIVSGAADTPGGDRSARLHLDAGERPRHDRQSRRRLHRPARRQQQRRGDRRRDHRRGT